MLSFFIIKKSHSYFIKYYKVYFVILKFFLSAVRPDPAAFLKHS